ncbi:unnamed protein product, partial [Urochloa humidicola]
DHEKKLVIMIDPRKMEEWCQDTPVLMYAPITLGFHLQYKHAMNEHINGWKEDIWKWKFIRAPGIAENIDGISSGYLILQYMKAWCAPEKINIYTVSSTYLVFSFCDNFFQDYIYSDLCTGSNGNAAE